MASWITSEGFPELCWRSEHVWKSILKDWLTWSWCFFSLYVGRLQTSPSLKTFCCNTEKIMSAAEGKPLQTSSENHQRQQPQQQENRQRLLKERRSKVPSSMSPPWCCLLARGQRRPGWSPTAGPCLIVWNNCPTAMWGENHTLIQAFFSSRPPLRDVGVGVWSRRSVLLALLITLRTERWN